MISLSAFERSLSGEEASAELAGVCFDVLMEQPLNVAVRPRELVTLVGRVFDPEHARELIGEHLPRLIEGLQRRTDELGETLKDWLTAEVDMELRAVCARPLKLSPERLQAWVHHELTEHVTRELVREALDQFIKAAKPGGQGGGLVGMASRGAFGFASKLATRASQSVGGVVGGALQGMGDQVEAHLRSLVEDFIKSSMQGLLERLTLILSTPEVALKLGAARLELYEALLTQPLSELTRSSSELELGEWARLTPELIGYHLNREALQEAMIAELELLLEELGEQPLKQLFGDDERLALLRAELVTYATPHVQHLLQSDLLLAWVRRRATEA
jgi:HAMP domain-containing protein